MGRGRYAHHEARDKTAAPALGAIRRARRCVADLQVEGDIDGMVAASTSDPLHQRQDGMASKPMIGAGLRTLAIPGQHGRIDP
jgi:hypothetical protein